MADDLDMNQTDPTDANFDRLPDLPEEDEEAEGDELDTEGNPVPKKKADDAGEEDDIDEEEDGAPAEFLASDDE